MKFIVFGSKGFIGSHLVKHLRAESHEVYGSDVVVEYNDSQYYHIDVSNATYEHIFAEHSFDVCINCAGASSVPDSFDHPSRDFHLNGRLVFDLLEAIRRNSPRCRFINLSSAAVYGNVSELPIAETTPCGPLSPYGWHKFYSELICKEFNQYFGIETCSVRIFSAYGPGLRKQIFWDWLQKVKRTAHISLLGSGLESRDFIFIDDLVRAISYVAKNGSFSADVYNIANGEQVSIRQAIQVFQSYCPFKFTFEFDNKIRRGDPANWMADISKLTQLGYVRNVSFDIGLKRFIDWACQNENA